MEEIFDIYTRDGEYIGTKLKSICHSENLEFYHMLLLVKLLLKVWICKKFDLPSEDEIVRDFEKETRTFLDAEKQVKKEDSEKEYELNR